MEQSGRPFGRSRDRCAARRLQRERSELGIDYVLAVLGHIAATAYLMFQVARSMHRPEHDVVRRLDVDDPQGGPFDNAPDRFVLDWRYRAQPIRSAAEGRQD